MDNITEKKKQIELLCVEDERLSSWIKASDLWCWTYSVLRVQGEGIRKGQIVDILDGIIYDNLPLETHRFIYGLSNLYRDMKFSISMRQTPDSKLIMRWLKLLYGEKGQIRDNNPVIYEWNYVPPHFGDVKALLDDIFHVICGPSGPDDPVETAICLHLAILKLYPFGDQSIAMAFACSSYCLLYAGYNLPEFSVNDREYNILVGGFISHNDSLPFSDMFRRAVYNRLEAVYQLSVSARDAIAQEAFNEAKQNAENASFKKNYAVSARNVSDKDHKL